MSEFNAQARMSYEGYETWKGWSKPFTYTPEEAEYFAGETRGLAIAGSGVLEIGFGSGSFLAWARDRGARVAGVEIIPALIEAARKNDVELLAPDLPAAEAQTARFDTILAFDVFEHFDLDDIRTCLARCAVMTASSGHLVLRFPNAQSPFGLAPQNGDPTHKSALSKSCFEQLIQGTPWRIVRYAPAFRTKGRGSARRLKRTLQYAVRDLISIALNLVYTQSIPWDPVVVLVLRRE
jgi:2-polyprenyl-3-methyl-5-hydroxy-6-metoxy-1,4-benzoquinol methylase